MKNKEKLIEGALLFCAIITIFTTVGIVYVLFSESFSFFSEVSIVDFFTDSQWTPLFAQKHFGIAPLITGTLLTTAIAMAVALPVGLTIAVYLSEYAPTRFKEIVKPLLEILAAVPTVVYGFFALVVVTPFLQSTFIYLAELNSVFKWMFGGLAEMSGFNAISPGIVMGIMIIPFISSLSQDALESVPKSLREASYGLGSTRLQTAFKVLIPAASSGIISSILLAFSRAIGETMIVAIAAGQQPRLTLDPTVPIETITAYIVQVSLGDVPHGSLEYKTIFAAGITLFLFTLILNNISFFVNRKYRLKYD